MRQYLFEDAVYFRSTCGKEPALWDALTPSVDELVGGEEHSLYRWELPDDHPLRHDGDLNDRLVLTGNDELVPRSR